MLGQVFNQGNMSPSYRRSEWVLGDKTVVSVAGRDCKYSISTAKTITFPPLVTLVQLIGNHAETCSHPSLLFPSDHPMSMKQWFLPFPLYAELAPFLDRLLPAPHPVPGHYCHLSEEWITSSLRFPPPAPPHAFSSVAETFLKWEATKSGESQLWTFLLTKSELSSMLRDMLQPRKPQLQTFFLCLLNLRTTCSPSPTLHSPPPRRACFPGTRTTGSITWLPSTPTPFTGAIPAKCSGKLLTIHRLHHLLWELPCMHLPFLIWAGVVHRSGTWRLPLNSAGATWLLHCPRLQVLMCPNCAFFDIMSPYGTPSWHTADAQWTSVRYGKECVNMQLTNT